MKLANHPYDCSELLKGLPGALWFLPVLFFVEIIYFFSSRIVGGGNFYAHRTWIGKRTSTVAAFNCKHTNGLGIL